MESTRRTVEPSEPAAPARGAHPMPDATPAPALPASRWAILLSLLALYLVWGSTYLAMRVAMEGFPPFRMASIRFLAAGTVLLAFARARGAPLPTALQWRNSLLVGTLLLAIGNGGVAYAEQTVSSGLAALVISGMPLWMVSTAVSAMSMN